MRNTSRRWIVLLLAVCLATAYGVITRVLAEREIVFEVMSVAFLFVVPGVLGALSVLPLRAPSLPQAILMPVLSSAITVGVAMLIELEGLICVAMALVPLVVLAAVGGVIVWLFKTWQKERERKKRDNPKLYGIALLPFLLAPLEGKVEAPLQERVVQSQIMIAASPADVWEEIVEVRPIEEHERKPALFTAIGFPRPVSAMVDRRELGGVREARFENGVLFLEEITRFEPDRALEFTIDAQEHLIPPTTLDPHVTIGGPYFDVLVGAYRIEPQGETVVLHLESRLRVSTRFNVYAGFWADRVMKSIQDNILVVVRNRAEKRSE